MNAANQIETLFNRLGFEEADFSVKNCATAPDKLIVICDTQSCGLYRIDDAMTALQSLDDDGDDVLDADVWGALDVALVEDDVGDRYDA